MDILIIVISIALLAIGFVGCILPVIPGPPIGYLSLLVLLLHSDSTTHLDIKTLIICAILIVVVTALDFILPAWGTKKFGGTQAGKNGSIVGLIAGLFFVPFGIILGPFIGAVVGELVGGSTGNTAIKSGIGSFLGFATGALLKIGSLVYVTYLFLKLVF